MGVQNITASAVEENAQNTTTVVGDQSALPVTPEAPATPTTPATPDESTLTAFDSLSSVPSSADDLANNASTYLDDQGLLLSDNVPLIDPDTTYGTELDADDYALDKTGVNVETTTGKTELADSVVAKDARTYEAETSADKVERNLAEAATTEVADESLIDYDSFAVDKQGAATGVNEDGSTNFTGVALNDFATQNISQVIDTSTISGKLLADKLGEGNYVDSKATVKGQLEILTAEFTDPNTGQPKIPKWASGLARAVSRNIAFKGISGTAATMAMATAMIEATLPIAEADSKFFQTLTEKNLDNKQQMIINKANVLSKLDVVDLEMRTSVAVQNAKTFMEYDLTNLNNEQQAAIINSQSMTQAILEDTKEVNVASRFGAEQQNITDRFYDELNTTISTFNAAQKNSMEQFNAGEINDNNQFNATMEDARERFYLEMSYDVDAANAKWRKDITLANTDMVFQAAAADVKNTLDITTEALNQLWDREDSLLDYAWKEGENEKDREITLEVAKMELEGARLSAKATKSSGKYQAVGAVLGAVLSDGRLKTNLVKTGELDNGLSLYTWDWNQEAIDKGLDNSPTEGVIAQEVYEVIPDAVILGNDGYLRVDYAKVLA